MMNPAHLISRLALIVTPIVIAASTAKADGWLATCQTDGGGCYAERCGASASQASDECKKACPGASIQTLSTDSRCGPTGGAPGGGIPIKYPKPKTMPSICSDGQPAPPNAVAGTKAFLDHVGGPKPSSTMACVKVPLGSEFKNTYCQLSDAWGAPWCRYLPTNPEAACGGGYWGWPSDAPPGPGYYPDYTTGGWQFCLVATNQSKDRNREFQLFGK